MMRAGSMRIIKSTSFLRKTLISSLSETERKGKNFAALWGNGDYGRLGLGGLESHWRPAFCSALANETLRQISCGGAHTLFLTETGCVYATGLNDFGQLGVSNKSYSTEPIKVCNLPKEVISISAGYHHSSAITVNGELYVWGRNSCGQLGLGKKAAKVIPVPTKVDCLNGVNIKMAALGSEHSIAVSDKGEVLSWGHGAERLGHGHDMSILRFLNSDSEYTPRLIKTLEDVKIKSVAAGMLHSVCLDENGTVFINGETTLDKMELQQPNNAATPSMLIKLPTADVIACGGYHTCVVTSGGELYAWGSNENGCLGTGCTTASSSPERVQGPFLRSPVNEVSCGWKHTAAISEGKVYTWGWGGSHGTFAEDGHSSGGQLGHSNDVDYNIPTVVNLWKNVKAVQVSCGFNHTAAILEWS